MIRVRIAPSPTGFAHVGTAYTALFNYAFARKNKGKFIIRIEDSDLKRNIPGAEDKIYLALEWLGISWDEGVTKGGEFGPYKLSDRLDLYKQKAEELVEKGLAYADEGAIRFKNPGSAVGWNDLIRGSIEFPGDQITDFVIMKSDGYPTYNFNVVVDDIEMQISHVIRGEDHISNTPRQIALYKAFGIKPPEFAHHPMLLNNKKQKLSKRDAAVDIEEYKKQGILPGAFVNFLSLLGWSHPQEKEIFSLDEFVKEFSLDRVGKSGAIFDLTKLEWINGQYIRETSDEEFISLIKSHTPENATDELLQKITPLIKDRIKKLSEVSTFAGFFFERPQVDKSLLGKNFELHLTKAIEALEKGESLEEVPKQNNFKTGDFFMDLRIAITGNRYTPPINESMVVLGREESIARLKALV